MAPSERYFSKVGAVAAIAGIVIYTVSKFVFHPMTPPQETEAAFADYAAESNWAVIHLGELLGILLMSGAIVALAWRLRRGVAGVWATLGAAAAVVFAGVYAVFIAVDGVAIGVLVDRWAEAGPEQQALLYETAFAVRQIEAGLWGVKWLLFGVATALFAAAFFATAESPLRLSWPSGMGWLSGVASVGALSFGVVQTQTGFTELSMSFQTALIPGIVWILAIGIFLYRHPEPADVLEEVPYREDDERRHEPAD
ncbi:hypothetical protein [Natronorubrum sp. FCH18a]|uniref:hypothetical protein n=1 Tax=Natronorubrum sp. FCH18a TaxID=3447018 RepID=UPI003F50E4F8